MDILRPSFLAWMKLPLERQGVVGIALVPVKIRSSPGLTCCPRGRRFESLRFRQRYGNYTGLGYDRCVADSEQLRALPSVHELVESLPADLSGVPRPLAVDEVRRALDAARAEIV